MPEEINLDIFNADPITEDVSDDATEAAPKTVRAAAMPPRNRRRTSAPR